MVRQKLTSIILALLSLFVFAGCASIEYQRVTDDYGKIVDKIVIEIDEKQLSKQLSSEKLELLKADIKNDIDNYVFALKQVKYDLIRTNTDPSLDFEEGIIIENTGWVPQLDNKNMIICQITYLNSTYLQKLNGSEEDVEETEDVKDDSTQIVKNLFISKYIMYNDNIFSGIEEMVGVGGKNYFNYYSSTYGEFGIDDVQLSQIYGTTDSRLRSNADQKQVIEGINYHFWEIGTKNEEYKSIKLEYYYRTAVGTGWYILALALSVALAIFLFLYYIMVVRKNNHREKVRIEEIIVNKFDED